MKRWQRRVIAAGLRCLAFVTGSSVAAVVAEVTRQAPARQAPTDWRDELTERWGA